MKKRDNLTNLIKMRGKLVKLRTALKSNGHKILRAGGIVTAKETMESDNLLDKTLSMDFGRSGNLEINIIREQIKSLNKSILEIDKELSDKAVSINTAFSKNKNLFLFAAGALIMGFLLVFFYQAMIDSDFVKFKKSYNFYSAEKTDKFYLLTGWEYDKEKDVKFASMKSKRAVFLFSVPTPDTLALKLTYRFPERDQAIEVYSQEQLIGTLTTDTAGRWTEKVLVFPHYLVAADLNKVVFVKLLDSKPDLYNVVVSNYEDRNLIFMRAYTVWESTRWYAKRRNNPVNWNLCFFGAVSFLCLWLVYSAFFCSVTNEKYLRILKLDFWTYLPVVIIFLMLFLISKFWSNYTFFYYAIDYWLILAGVTGVGKSYQIIKYGKMDKFKLRLRQTKDYAVGKYDLCGAICIGGFAVIFLGCAVLLMFNRKVQAERLGNWAFLLLILGVVLKTIDYFVKRQYLDDK